MYVGEDVLMQGMCRAQQQDRIRHDWFSAGWSRKELATIGGEDGARHRPGTCCPGYHAYWIFSLCPVGAVDDVRCITERLLLWL